MLLKHQAKQRRHQRIRKSLRGTTMRPRLCVFKSAKHLQVQVIDDSQGRTLVAASTLSSELRQKGKSGNCEGAAMLGKLIAEKAQVQNIKAVVFDRGGTIYHGRVKALAEAAREAGLEF